MQPKSQPLTLQPGIYSEGSDRVAVNRWRRGNRVRFHNGFAEKLGGWVRENLASPTLPIGVPRSARDWARLDGTNVLAAGTESGVHLWVGETYFDATPIAKASTGEGGAETPLTDPFTTTDTSPVVSVAHTAHGLTPGTKVTYSGSTPVGGLSLDGSHFVTQVVDSDTYTITASSPATSSATGGGTVEYVYRFGAGGVATTPGAGYGIGPYGAEEYGTPRTVGGGGAPITTTRARIWSLQNWGEDLIVCPRGGGLYVWDSSELPFAEATRIPNSPYEALGVVVSPRDRHLIAYGCTPEAAGATDPLDPLVIRWCSQNDYTNWTSSATTTAGELRIEQGTEILQGFLAGNNILFITETAAYRMFATQSARIFGLLGIGEAGGISPQGGISFQDKAYWIGWENFFTFQGSIQEIPCDVHSAVFDDFNFDQRDLVVAGINRRFSEVYWHYPSKGSQEVDRYVAHNVVERVWHVGELDRSAWYGSSVRFPNAYGFAPTGELYVHEIGSTADGQSMGEWLESYDMMIPSESGASTQTRPILRVNSIAQDFSLLESSLSVELQYRKQPGRGKNASTPVIVTLDPSKKVGAGEIRRRGRGRYVSIRIDGSGFTGDWRLGSMDINAQPDGGR